MNSAPQPNPPSPSTRAGGALPTSPTPDPPGILALLIALGGLGFGGYLVWYGVRGSGDTEALMVAAGVVPLGLLLLARWVASRKGALIAALVSLALGLGYGGYTAWGWQVAQERVQGYADRYASLRIAQPLCEERRPLPAAPAYDPTTPPHTIHVFGSIYGDGRPLNWIPWAETGYPPGWRSEDLPELVACMRNRYTVLDTRTYTGQNGRVATVSARQHHYDVEVFVARTRESLGTFTIDGAVPLPLTSTIRAEGHHVHDQDGRRITPAQAAPSLMPYVVGP